jgi:NAD+ diphosphatase
VTCCVAAIAFSGSKIERADHIRTDPERLAALKSPQAQLLLLDGLVPLLDDANRLRWGGIADAPDGSELVFLGLMNSRGAFAVVPQEGNVDPAFAQRATWQAVSLMDADDMAIYGCARSLVDWHARHRFCAKCGAPTALAKGGWQRNCTAETCKAEHFPRVDPVTIMLVEHEGKLLLGRQPRFPPRRFSALAGFVEPGEAIEEAVAREVLEEAGVKVRDVTYVSSQPWPFPSQLMIGCHAFAESSTLRVDTTELEEAHWFTREEIAAAMAGDENGRLLTPPSVAIAHQLLKWWLEK